MNQNVVEFIATLRPHFYLKHDDEAREAEWLASMSRMLKNFDTATLKLAAGSIIYRRKDRRFPLPAECLQACHDARRFQAAEPARLPPAQQLGEYDPYRIKRADQLVMGDMGQRASKEGWIVSLHDFCRKHLRLPEDGYIVSAGDRRLKRGRQIGDVIDEIRICKQGAKEFDQAFGEVVRGTAGGDLRKELTALGDNLLKKREDLRSMVLDGVLPDR